MHLIVAFEISVLLPFVCVCTRALVRVNKTISEWSIDVQHLKRTDILYK